ncbi:hypothetical protein EZS27_021057, partial [termite gut metagenome]
KIDFRSMCRWEPSFVMNKGRHFILNQMKKLLLFICFLKQYLFKSDNESIARTIAELPAFHRTEAFKYVFEGTTFCVWYLRIRKNIFNDHQFAGVVKVEMILTTEEEIEEGMNTDVINQISAHLINERNPVCYGTDKRWANHIYPVYLTESFIKSQYIGDSFFLNLF